MSDVDLEDLAELRRRVYGPEGDLHRDADAIARLSALTPLHRIPAAAPIGSDPIAAEPDGGADAESSPVTPSRPRLDRRIKILWATSVAAAVLLTAAATSWIYSPPGSQIAALTLHKDRELSTYGSGFSEDALVTDDFHGLTVVRLRQDQTSPMLDGGCIQVISTVRNPRVDATFGCGAGPFVPSAPMTVTQTSPRALRSAFPIGTTLQFALQDGVVKVRSGGQSLAPFSSTEPLGFPE